MQVDTGTEMVLAEVVDGVGVVTLNRPERRNALHADMYRVVPEVVARFIHDADVGCILVTGAGDAFCAGGDVKGDRLPNDRPDEGDDGGQPRRPTIEEAAALLTHDSRMVAVLHGAPKVTIAALPGAAVGAGLSIALATDLRIAAQSARLVPGWGRLAFSGDFGGTWFLTRLVGPSRALEILLDDVTLDADAALRLGLVNRVVPDGELRVAALEWARSLAAKPRTMQRYVKANVRQSELLPLDEALPLESERQVRSARTDEHRAAVKEWLAAAESRRRRG